MIDFDELRKTVAIKHNVLLGPDDPILVTVTLNDLVLSRYVEILTAQNEDHQKALAAALHAHIEESKATAGRVITDAADYVSKQVRQAVTAAVAEASVQLRQDLVDARAASREVAAGADTARAARITAIAASAIAAICALVAVAAVVVVMVK
ncbi:MAG TPA: conjugal transfer protein TraM [Halothiobacillus sp.]|nr:conjugal transfer protein TraM [Halothiobacillus sp.]